MKVGLSTGNTIVDQIGRINFQDLITTVIPVTWYQYITKASGTPDMLAIILLAEIVYWYRPTVILDPDADKVLGYKKKFTQDRLQKSYSQLAKKFGLSKKQAEHTVGRLKKLGLIRTELRTVQTPSGPQPNTLYLEPVPEVIENITFGVKSPMVKKHFNKRDSDEMQNPEDTEVNRGVSQPRGDPLPPQGIPSPHPGDTLSPPRGDIYKDYDTDYYKDYNKDWLVSRAPKIEKSPTGDSLLPERPTNQPTKPSGNEGTKSLKSEQDLSTIRVEGKSSPVTTESLTEYQDWFVRESELRLANLDTASYAYMEEALITLFKKHKPVIKGKDIRGGKSEAPVMQAVGEYLGTTDTATINRYIAETTARLLRTGPEGWGANYYRTVLLDKHHLRAEKPKPKPVGVKPAEPERPRRLPPPYTEPTPEELAENQRQWEKMAAAGDEIALMMLKGGLHALVQENARRSESLLAAGRAAEKWIPKF